MFDAIPHPVLKRFACLTLMLGAVLPLCRPAWSASEYSTVVPAAKDRQGYSIATAVGAQVLSEGAQVLDIPASNTFALAWFPRSFRNPDAQRRTLFVLHGANENAYQALNRHLPDAKQNGYGIVALQWQKQGDTATGGPSASMTPTQIQQTIANMMPYLISRYGVFPNMSGLFGTSTGAEAVYEMAFWDRLNRQDFYRIVFAESGGVSATGARPVIAKMAAIAEAKEKAALAAAAQPQPAKPAAAASPATTVALAKPTTAGKPVAGKPVAAKPAQPKPPEDVAIQSGKALAGKKFFLYCGAMDGATCESVRNAKKMIESQGASVVKAIEDPALSRTGLTDRNDYRQSAVQAFLSATAGFSQQ